MAKLEVGSTNVENGTKATAPQFGELVDTEHLHVVSWTVLAGEPLFQLHHLHVLEANAGIDGAFNYGFGDVHAAADGGVVSWGHAIVFG